MISVLWNSLSLFCGLEYGLLWWMHCVYFSLSYSLTTVVSKTKAWENHQKPFSGPGTLALTSHCNQPANTPTVLFCLLACHWWISKCLQGEATLTLGLNFPGVPCFLKLSCLASSVILFIYFSIFYPITLVVLSRRTGV